MKRLLLLGALMFVLASCMRDPKGPESGNDSEIDGQTSPQEFVHLSVDQSRVGHDDNPAAAYYNAVRNAYLATRASVNAPSVESIIDFDYNSASVFPHFVGSDSKLNGGNYKITESGNYEIQAGTLLGETNVVILSGNTVTLNNSQNSEKLNIYVLPGAKLNISWWVQKKTNIYCWGELNFPNEVTMQGDSSIYYYGDELVIDVNFTVTNIDAHFEFDSYAPVFFNKEANIYGGSFHFYSQATFENLKVDNFNDNNEYDDNKGIIFDDCATIRNISLGGPSMTPVWKVNKYLYIGNLSNTHEGNKLDIELHNALLVIDNKQQGTYWQRQVTVTGYSTDEQTSGVRILSPLTLYSNQNSSLAPQFKGNLTILGEKIDATTSKAPELKLNASWQRTYEYNEITFNDEVEINKEDAYLKDFGETDCRHQYTYGEPTDEPKTDYITPPAHKYSATSLDFSTDGKYIYVSWHSNLPGGESQEDGNGNQFDHDHGTNVDSGNNTPGYGGPSVDDDEDWGGFVDIIEIEKYNPETEEGYRIVQTLENQEHKYNHIKLYKNTLYLTTTSWYVGAALQVAPLNETGTDVVENVAYRVNLTGISANCVEIVNDKDIVTVSGRSVGGLNWFSLSDWSNQEKKYKAGKSYYGGKYVCIGDDGNVYVLHNTDNATVTCYNANGEQLGEMTTNVRLVPNDGKNTLQVKNGRVYVCCGQNGLRVYQWNGRTTTNEPTVVGRTRVSANCVDVDSDNKYFYVATGAGVAKFNVNEFVQQDGINYFKKEKTVAYKGRGFSYPNGTEEDGTMPDGTVKESSNFVRVFNGKVYVAYGMYGLRIYNADDLTSVEGK